MTTVRHFGIDRTTACGRPAHRYSNHYETNGFEDEQQLFDYSKNGFERVDRGHPKTNTVRNAVLARLDGLNIEAKYLQGDMETDVEDRLEDPGYL